MDKGYGFIGQDGKEDELFFHATEVEGVAFNDLKEGDVVTFEVVEGKQGKLQAVKVSKGGKAPASNSSNEDEE